MHLFNVSNAFGGDIGRHDLWPSVHLMQQKHTAGKVPLLLHGTELLQPMPQHSSPSLGAFKKLPNSLRETKQEAVQIMLWHCCKCWASHLCPIQFQQHPVLGGTQSPTRLLKMTHWPFEKQHLHCYSTAASALCHRLIVATLMSLHSWCLQWTTVHHSCYLITVLQLLPPAAS